MPRSQDERIKTRIHLFQLELGHLRAAEQHWNNAQKAYEVDDEKRARIQECRAKAAESRAKRCRIKHEYLDLEEDVGGGDEMDRISRMSKKELRAASKESTVPGGHTGQLIQ